MLGNRDIKGWIYYITWILGKHLKRLIHTLNPSWHKWQYRLAPECGCCGGNGVVCYGCWTYIEIDDLRDKAIKQFGEWNPDYVDDYCSEKALIDSLRKAANIVFPNSRPMTEAEGKAYADLRRKLFKPL